MRATASFAALLLCAQALAQTWPDVKVPGLCVFYENGSCRYRGKNGYHSSSKGPCPDEMKGIVPSCRGHPDAWLASKPQPEPSHPILPVDPPKPVVIEIGGQGQLSPEKPVPINDSESRAQVGAPLPDSNASGPSRDEEQKHWIIVGSSVGAAVLVAIVLLLTLAFFAYRARQRATRRNELRQAAGVTRSQQSNLHNTSSPSAHL